MHRELGAQHPWAHATSASPIPTCTEGREHQAQLCCQWPQGALATDQQGSHTGDKESVYSQLSLLLQNGTSFKTNTFADLCQQAAEKKLQTFDDIPGFFFSW